MRMLAPDVHQLRGFAPHAINAYLVAGVLVDAGTPLARRRILRQLRGHEVAAHVVTHTARKVLDVVGRRARTLVAISQE